MSRWSRVDPSKVDPDLLAVAKAASLVERNGGDYATYLCNVFSADPRLQAAVRANLSTWYRDLVVALPKLDKGWVDPMSSPGLGTELQPNVLKRKNAIIRVRRFGAG
jgi:L-alanine-DL-glutamate epimerase-like enolase superfamily enzyme